MCLSKLTPSICCTAGYLLMMCTVSTTTVCTQKIACRSLDINCCITISLEVYNTVMQTYLQGESLVDLLAFRKAVFMSMLVEEMVGDEKRDLLLLGPCTGESEQGKSVKYILHCNVNRSFVVKWIV